MEKSDVVDVWLADIAAVESDVATEYADWLDTREQARVARLSRPSDVQEYVVAHGLLRAILAQYADGVSPKELRYEYGPFGKPELPGSDMQFNMSDSGGALVVAVARGVEVGVDIERRRPIDALKFARRFFTPWEADVLDALPGGDQHPTFFRMWTCKEAYVKGWGLGIRRHLRNFEVSALPGDLSRLVSCKFDPQSPAHWSLLDISDIEGYAATVAVKSPHAEVRFHRW